MTPQMIDCLMIFSPGQNIIGRALWKVSLHAERSTKVKFERNKLWHIKNQKNTQVKGYISQDDLTPPDLTSLDSLGFTLAENGTKTNKLLSFLQNTSFRFWWTLFKNRQLLPNLLNSPTLVWLVVQAYSPYIIVKGVDFISG